MNIHSGKDESIRWMNSLTNATNLVSSIKEIEDPSSIKQMISSYANFLFDLEPAKTELENKIKEAKTIDDLNDLKEAVIRTDSVAMFNLWNERKIAIGE